MILTRRNVNPILPLDFHMKPLHHKHYQGSNRPLGQPPRKGQHSQAPKSQGQGSKRKTAARDQTSQRQHPVNAANSPPTHCLSESDLSPFPNEITHASRGAGQPLTLSARSGQNRPRRSNKTRPPNITTSSSPALPTSQNTNQTPPRSAPVSGPAKKMAGLRTVSDELRFAGATFHGEAPAAKSLSAPRFFAQNNLVPLASSTLPKTLSPPELDYPRPRHEAFSDDELPDTPSQPFRGPQKLIVSRNRIPTARPVFPTSPEATPPSSAWFPYARLRHEQAHVIQFPTEDRSPLIRTASEPAERHRAVLPMSTPTRSPNEVLRGLLNTPER